MGNHWTYEATYLGERSTRGVEMVAFRDGSYVDRDGRALRLDREGIRRPGPLPPARAAHRGRHLDQRRGPGLGEHYRLLSVHAPCEAPAGRFPDCIEVESRTVADPADARTGPGDRVTFAAGVGIVRVRTELEEGAADHPDGGAPAHRLRGRARPLSVDPGW